MIIKIFNSKTRDGPMARRPPLLKLGGQDPQTPPFLRAWCCQLNAISLIKILNIYLPQNTVFINYSHNFIFLVLYCYNMFLAITLEAPNVELSCYILNKG